MVIPQRTTSHRSYQELYLPVFWCESILLSLVFAASIARAQVVTELSTALCIVNIMANLTVFSLHENSIL